MAALAILLTRTLSLLLYGGAAYISAGFLVVLAFEIDDVFIGYELGKDTQLRELVICCLAFSLCVFTLVFPFFANAILDQKLGARRPSQDEEAFLERAFAEVKKGAKENHARLPHFILRVQDSNEVNAYAFGSNRVMLTKGLLRYYKGHPESTSRLSGLIAHELGHLSHWDTRFSMLTSALYFPIIIGTTTMRYTFGFVPIAGLVFHVIAALLMLPKAIADFIHGSTSRLQEDRADAFAKRIVGGQAVADALEDIAEFDEWKGGSLADAFLRSHPSTELRREKMQA